MMELPKINPLVTRQEDEPGFEREIWQPTWNCFCCQDTGIVRPYLAELVIDGYNWNIHKLPACMNPKCKCVSTLGEAMSRMLDCRLSTAICEQLDQFAREDWKTTIEFKHEILQQLADSKSLRSCSRTQEEENMVQEKKRMLDD